MAKSRKTTAKRAPKPKAAPRKRSATKKTAPPPLNRRRAATSPGAVMQVLDEAEPREALAKLLDELEGTSTPQDGLIALGAAQLMLASVARGSGEAQEIVELVTARWDALPDHTGFHAQEFLRNAFAAVGGDRETIGRLATLVPIDASPELRFSIACAYAVAGDRHAMLRELEAALAVGVAPAQITRERDFADYADDPGLRALLDRVAERDDLGTN